MKSSFLLALMACAACGTGPQAQDDDDGGGAGGQGAAGGSGGSGGIVEPTRVEVGVLDPWGQPVEGIEVLSHDGAGGVVEQGSTDAQGRATVTVSEGGMVTALWAQPSPSSLVTTPSHMAVSLTDVAPGSRVLLPIELSPPPEPHRMTVRVSRSSLPSSTAKVFLFLSCLPAVPIEDASASLAYGGCPGMDTFDAIVVALDQEGKLRGAMTWEDEPISDGLETTFTLFSTAFSTAPASLELEPQGLPPSSEFSPFLTSVSLTSHGPSGEWASTFSSTIQWAVPRLVPPFDAASGTFDVSVQLFNGIDQAHGYRERRADMASGLVYVFSDLAVPQIDASDLTSARPRVSYSLPQGATVGDAISTTIDWGLEPNRWVVHAPAALQGEVMLPELPDTLSDWAPQPSIMRATVTHSDMDGASGRDELLGKRSESSWYIAESSAITQ